MSSLTRDFFRSLPPPCRLPHRLEEEVGETEENGVELSLGLSLNGQFGVDPGKEKIKLSRSSSIPEFLSPSPALKTKAVAFSASIIRTCSLPAETVESRKRREVESLRRLEAKRKRAEKLSVPDCGNLVTEDCQNNGFHVKPRTPSQQGSVGSQGSGTGSSGISSDSDIQQQFQEIAPKSPAVQGPTRTKGLITMNGNGLPPKGDKGTRKIVSEVMPYVFTKGDGPDGKRVEGFLYQYRKGEEVRIVCVCHGSFFSPAEFVRHAGGGDVANPMRHIVVMPSSLT